MKKIILTLLLGSALGINAQESQKNHISFNPANLAFGTLQVQYERGINKDMTVGLSLGTKFSSGIFKISGFDSDRIKTDDFSYTGIKLIPEYRWYLQNTDKSYTGFYVGAYYKFQSYTDDIKGTYYSTSGETSPIDVKAKLVSNAFGLEAGYKLPIKKHFFIDFVIMGPGYSSNSLTITKNQPLPLEFYKDAIKGLKNKYDFLGQIGDKEFKHNGDNTSTVSFGLPAFRYGINLGYSF